MQIFLRIIKTAGQGFWRNGWISFVAIFIMMQVLLLVGILMSINLGVNKTVIAINDRIDASIFFQDYIEENVITGFADQIKNVDGIKEIIYISRDQALTDYVASNQQNKDLLGIVGDDSSFFPASLNIKVSNPDSLERVISQIKNQDKDALIAGTSLERNQDLVNKLRKLNQLLAIANLAVSLILIIIALLIIFNTIRITIFTRKEEIKIMKLVGATNWYIRWPFIIEGIIYGVAGAILAFLLTLGIYQTIQLVVGDGYWSINSLLGPTGPFNYLVAVQLFVFQLLFGVFVGAISSYLSTKRYLAKI